MRPRLAIVLGALAVLGCDRRERSRNAGGSLAEADPTPTSANVYRFAADDEARAAARKAAEEERWDQALALSEALLARRPDDADAQRVAREARLELANQQHYNQVLGAAQASDLGLALRHYHQISEGSVYRERARAPVDRLREAQQVAMAAAAVTTRSRLDETPAAAPPPPPPPPPTPTAAPAPPAAPPARPTVVPLTAIESQLVSGDREIRLPAPVVRDLAGKGMKQAIVMVKLCIDGSGAVASTDVVKSSGLAEADQSVAAGVRTWRFRPYLVNGQPAPVCTVKLFRYVIE